MNIDGAVVIVTGASSGIGLATTRLLAAKQARVALVARSANTLTQLATELPGSLAVPTDLRDVGAIRAMVDTVYHHYGRIDVLINNAGQGMHGPIEQADPDHYRALFDLNVVSALVAMQAVIPIMRRQQHGVIINVSAGLSKVILPQFGPYASTKAALDLLSRTARAELHSANVHVGVVYLGRTTTDFMHHAVGGLPPSLMQDTMPPGDTPQQSAVTIIKAVETEAEETYAESIALPTSMRSR